MLKEIGSLIFCATVIGCATRPHPAPIENMTNIPNYVQPGTSPTAAVAQATPVTPTPAPQMAALNDNRKETNSMTSVPSTVKPIKTPVTKAPATSSATLVSGGIGGDWVIPTVGKTEGYTAGGKGIDIYGLEGQSIVAINDGKVVYSGNGLKGYGNLIIVKHSDSYLSAYAHNKANLVKEGAAVKRGQQIATMGTDDSGKAVLHLEVRKNGKPIDPFMVIKTK